MRTLGLALLLLRCCGLVFPFCVLDSKKGWWLDCGLRDSYLFRIKDFGGIQANFDLGFGFGDEKGFPNSISKTNHKAKGPSKFLPPPPIYHPGHGPSYHRMDNNVIQNRRSNFPYQYEVPSQYVQAPASQPQFHNARSRTASQHQDQPGRQAQNRKWISVPQRKRSQPSYSQPHQPHQPRTQWTNQPRPQTGAHFAPQQLPPPSWQPLRPRHQDASVASRRAAADQRHNNRFSFIPPTNSFNQRRHQVNSFPPSFANPARRMIPPPPLPPLPPPPPPPSFHDQNYRRRHTPPPFDEPFVFHVPTTTTEPPRTIGPAMSEILNVPSFTLADTDNVPSFAAKMFIVREAPREFYPPNYTGEGKYNPHKPKIHVQIPRTKFYCEDQKYLPGIYADAMLGCKMFHLCVPSAVGSTLTSYLCPNGTLFDQSILQCNYWYNVDCESSTSDYDSNLALALSYRRINAAYLPLQAATNVNTLSLLSQNVNQFQSSDTKSKFSRRLGRVFDSSKSNMKGSNTSVREHINNSLENETLVPHNETLQTKVEMLQSESDLIANNFIDPSSLANFSSILSNHSSENDVFNLSENKDLINLIIKIQNQFKNKKYFKENKYLLSKFSVQNSLQNETDSDWKPFISKELIHYSKMKRNNSNVTQKYAGHKLS